MLTQYKIELTLKITIASISTVKKYIYVQYKYLLEDILLALINKYKEIFVYIYKVTNSLFILKILVAVLIHMYLEIPKI